MHWPFKVIEKLQTEAFILNRIPTRIHTRTGAAGGGKQLSVGDCSGAHAS